MASKLHSWNQGDQMSLLKIAQSVAKLIFVKINTQLSQWTIVDKKLGYFCNCQKTAPKKTITQQAKIRPIWSPCLALKPILFQAFFPSLNGESNFSAAAQRDKLWKILIAAKNRGWKIWSSLFYHTVASFEIHCKKFAI
jgi:hypothetical protein